MKKAPDDILLDALVWLMEEVEPPEFPIAVFELWSIVTARVKEQEKSESREAKGKGKKPRIAPINWMAGNGLSIFREALERIRHQLPNQSLELIGPTTTDDTVVIRRVNAQ